MVSHLISQLQAQGVIVLDASEHGSTLDAHFTRFVFPFILAHVPVQGVSIPPHIPQHNRSTNNCICLQMAELVSYKTSFKNP